MNRNRVVSIGGVVLVAAGFLLLACLQAGCAVARGPDGAVVWGWEAGKLAEGAEEGIVSIGNQLGTYLGLGGGGVGALALAGWTAARARFKEHKATWDEVTGTPPAASGPARYPAGPVPGVST